LTAWSKCLLGFLCATFMFVAFKHGFVRGDHVPIAFNCLILFILIIGFISIDVYLLTALGLAVVTLLGIPLRTDPILINEVRASFGYGTTTDLQHRREVVIFIAKKSLEVTARTTYKQTVDTYIDAWRGLRLRTAHGDALQDRFRTAIANIRSEYAVPPLSGTVDIYTYEQVLVLASNNIWNPRPIFQSYSAYTPELALINARHLRTESAPEWIMLELTTLDGRLPSLDDGLSWPALLDNYAVTSFDGRFVVLHKKQVVQPQSKLDVLYQERQTMGATLSLPEANGPVYAEIDIRPTLVGRLMALLYKPPELNLVLNLKNGEAKTYRIIANMAVTGFILSPLVRDTADFVALAQGDAKLVNDEKVVSLSIEPSYGRSIFWSSTYSLTLKAYHPNGGAPAGPVAERPLRTLQIDPLSL
jgi:hypothetical protein